MASDTLTHTPGPWTAHEMLHFGEPGTGFWNVQPIGEADDTWSEADARLVAAAPELLAASKAWLEHFDQMDRATDADDPLRRARHDYHGQRIEQLRAAIAKAEGR